jgi:YYY domain-containing protein
VSRARARLLLGGILLFGAWLRFQGLNWDSGHHLHPDERFISMVDDQLRGGGIAAFFRSPDSKMNPYNVGFGSFVYGTLPMHAAHAVADLFGKSGYDRSFLFGRALSGLSDLITVWLVYLIARRFADRGAALCAAGFLAASPLAIQLSHFWTVDTFLTTATAAALLAAVRLAHGRHDAKSHLFAGVAIALAVACKITGLALFLPVGIGMLLGLARDRERGQPWGRAIGHRAAMGVLLLAGFLVTVRLALPYAFLGERIFSFALDPRWLSDIRSLTSLTSSVAAFPPNYQWAGRSVLFGIQNIVLWGAAPFFGLAAVAGLVWAIAVVRTRPYRALLPLLLYTLFLLAYHGLTMAKSIRYHYPAYPVLAVVAALFLSRLAASPSQAAPSRWRRAIPAIALTGTFLAGIAFTAIYRQEHTRVEASRWIYSHVPAGARFANETWDDGLPLGQPGYDARDWSGIELDVVAPDNRQKAERLVAELTKAGGIAITSNRAYGTLTRIPAAFPMMHAYYRALFEGRLGFRLVADIHSYPRLGPLAFPDDASDEAFTVYDHPRVLLFRKTDEFSPERLRAILLAALPAKTPTLHELEKATKGRIPVAKPVRPPLGGAREARPVSELAVSSPAAAVLFYLAIAAFGAAVFPLLFLAFPRLSDHGAGIARLAGLALATWTLMILVSSGLAENGPGVARGVFLALLGVGGAAAWRLRHRLSAFWRPQRRAVLEGEAVFLAGFLLFVGLRAANPEIFWGEKPMDFSILNVLVRTRVLPASDPWFAGAPLGYYVFGQEMIALLSLVTGLSTRFTFNLAFGLIGGATLQAAWSLVRSWTGRRLAAAAGAVFVLIAGNLAGLRDWLVRRPPLDWHYFWATSRVVPDTINEYPFWSLLFADLHAHVFAIPMLLLTLTAALQLVRAHASPESTARERLLSAGLLGAAAAAHGLTNAWDVPLLFGLLLLSAVAAATLRKGWTGVGQAAIAWAVSLTTAFGLALPLWVRGGGAPGYGWHVGQRPRVVDVLTIFGLFFFLALCWLTIESWRSLRALPGNRLAQALLVAGIFAIPAGAALLWGVEALAICGVLAFLAAAGAVKDPERRLACLLTATGFFLIGLPQRVYIYDHMNTVFKLYLEAWVLFAVATAVLAFGRGRRRLSAPGPAAPALPDSFEQWPLLLRAGFAILLMAALFTTATAARGAIDARLHRPAPSGARDTAARFVRFGPPTLDGLAWLAAVRPAEARAVDWLRANVRGTPVLLEAQGASYADFSRISGFTGIPTVLGWEHHVKQRGNSEREVEERRTAVRRIYASPSADSILPLLHRYRVGYVYVGWLERETYPLAGLAKFDGSKDFRLAYSNPEVKIYRVVGGDTEDVPLPVREIVPQSEGGEVLEPEEAPSISATAAPDLSPWANLREPRGATLDRQGRLWVADTGHNRLRLYDARGGTLGGWGGRNDSPYGFREPGDASALGDRLYVADTWNSRLLAYSLEGQFLGSVDGLFGARGIAAAEGRVYASDTGNHRIAIYDAELKLIRIVGGKGTSPLQFDSPVGLAAGPSGEVFVADVMNRRIQVLDGEGALLRIIAFPGWTSWCEPYLAADADGTLYVSSPLASSVLVIAPDGRFVRTILESDAKETFSRPSGIAIDRDRRVLYVVDSGKNTVFTVTLPAAARTRKAAGLPVSFSNLRQGPRDVTTATTEPLPRQPDPPARGSR